MAIFQKSIQKKYLRGLNENQVNEAWERFKSHFHNSAIQENIRRSKEEQYQGEFIIDLFVKVLGYTNHPLENYNLIREQKNVKDAKSADGAIIKDGKIIAVIELKGTDTTNLSNIETQAFGYKNNQPDAVYVITSNFEKLRFYIDNAVDFEDFNLFQLTKDEFQFLWLCLSKESIFQGTPKQIKNESLAVEETVTNKLYKDYSAFRNDIFTDIVKNNPQYDKLTLFNKTQKLLDRFLFVFFAEDRLLLPPNSIREIINQWTDLRDHFDEYQPLYSRFIKYFGYLNTGYKGKKHDIFAYNGGLFLPDEILDNIKIDDTLLYKHTLNLSNYDFESEVSVNILGHIFEHSLSEIEEIQAELEGQVVDKSKTKRKTDGVYYTPKFVTKYIVDCTVGNLCKQKKAELGIIEEEYEQERTGKQNKAKVKALQGKIEQYRNWLLEVTICDPACGSGAFLNQALEFLITEHRYIDELQAKLFGDRFVFQNVESSILENNLFGVDINDESIEIAKLSLWLRTAQKGRKLTSLSSNIKCGNSLIADKKVAGDKAFDWRAAFPQVFEKGGFDIVIGNPPYVQSHSISEKEKSFYYSNYATTEYQINTYALFIEKIFDLIKNGGYFAYIVPNYFLSTQYDRKLRSLIFIQNHALEILNTYRVFESATVDTLILVGTNSNISPKNTIIRSVSPNCKSILERLEQIGNKEFSFCKNRQFEDFQEDDIVIYFDTQLNLNGQYRLSDFFNFFKGMQPYEQGKGKPSQTREMMTDKIYHSDHKIDDNYLPLLTASSIKRYITIWEGNWIKYGANLAAPRKKEIFEGERLLLNRIVSKERLDITYEFETKINNSDIFNLKPKKEAIAPFSTKALLAIIASKLCAVYFKKQNINLNRDVFPKINVNTLETFPIPNISNELCEELGHLSDNMLDYHTSIQKQTTRFIKLLQSSFSNLKVNKKIENWHYMTFGEFRKELEKQKIIIAIKELMDYQDLFDTSKNKINELQTKIGQTENTIDKLVYQLYGLTQEEIEIVEGQN